MFTTNYNNGVGGAMYPPPPLPQQPSMIKPYQGRCMSHSPPGFLMKAYSIVDDPNTNDIISWSLSGTSLIIWDHIKLAEQIIPMYFKHNNLSSFIYQLNNYGFRKIGLEQWEYENPWFQKGNKRLLLNIKRRDKTVRVIKRRASRKRSLDDADSEINNTQFEKLRNHVAVYKEEIQKLKEQQALVQDKIASFKEDICIAKDNSTKIITFLAKAFGDIILKDVTQHSGDDIVYKENGKVADNCLTSEIDYSSKHNIPEANTSRIRQENSLVDAAITEANPSKSYQDNTFWKRFLEVDVHNENESEPDFERRQFMLNMELDDMMETNVELATQSESQPREVGVGGVNICLWT